MRISGKVGFLIALGAIITMSSTTAFGLAQFARKESVNCMTCHTVIPQLNRTGFEYRAAGFRMPDKIGVDQTSTNFGDMNSFRYSVSAKHNEVSPQGQYNTAATTFEAKSISLHILTGSFGTNFSSFVETSIGPKFLSITTGSNAAASPITMGNIFMGAVYGTADVHWGFRLGSFKPAEGYMAGDRGFGASLGISPVAPANVTATGWAGKGYGTSAQASPGFEAAYAHNDTDVAVGIMNGLEFDVKDKALHGIGNGYSSRSEKDSLYNEHDYYFRFNQFIGEKNAVGGYYYSGRVSLPISWQSTTPFSPAAYEVDSYTRTVLYGNYWVNDSINVNLGYNGGTDKFYNFDTTTTSGYFVEGQFFRNDNAVYGFRYDTSKYTNDSNYDQWQADIFYSIAWKNGLYMKADYANKVQQAGVGADDVNTRTLSLTATLNY